MYVYLTCTWWNVLYELLLLVVAVVTVEDAP